MCSKLTCLVVSIVVGVVAIMLGIILGFKVLPDSLIANNVQLVQGSDQYARWQNLSFPLTFKIYVFNVTNSKDVMTGNPPILKEIGPYVYRQYREKINVKYDDTRQTFTYEQIPTFEFDEELSKPLTENGTLHVIHVPKWIFLEYINSLNSGPHSWQISPFRDADDTVFHDVSMKKYFFEGYTFCSNDSEKIKVCDEIRKAAKNMTMMVVTEKDVSFSFFGHKNKKSDGVYTISSGISDARKTGRIDTFDGLKYTKFWRGGKSKCNKVRGTDSFIYSPYNNKDTVNEVFISDICRTVSLDYLEDVEYLGIPGHRYVMRRNTLDSPTNNKENKCFCIKSTRTVDGKKECHPDGFLDMGHCTNSPFLASFPHFLWADPEYVRRVNGVSPNDQKHRTFVDLEPNTGSPMREAKRLQFNMVIRRLPQFTLGNNTFTKFLPKVVFPVLWFEEGLEIPQDLLGVTLKRKVLSKLPIVHGVLWGLLVAGIVVILIGVIIYFCSRAKIRKILRMTPKNNHKEDDRIHTTDHTRQTTDDRHTTGTRSTNNDCVPAVVSLEDGQVTKKTPERPKQCTPETK